MNRNSQFTFCHSSNKTFRIFNDGTCWRMILNSFSQLFIGDNHQPLFSCLPQFFLKFPHMRLLLRTFCGTFLYYVHTGHCSFEHSVGMYSYFWMWRMSINAAKWTCLIFCFYVPSLWPPFIPFPLSLFASGVNIAWDERSFIHTSRFPEACVSERPPESSEPYVTLDSSKFRWTEPHSEFILLPFPSSHLRVSRTLPDFEGVLEEFSSHWYAVPRDEK